MRSIDEENADVNQTRRQTIGVGTKSKALMTATTPASHSQSKKTPSKTRVNLGSASSYYFKHMPKTPLDVSMLSKNQQMIETSVNTAREDSDIDISINESFLHDATANYNGSLAAAESSFLTVNSSSSEESDMLNKSTLSDTTELTASNFVKAAFSRHRLSEASLLPTSLHAYSDQNVKENIKLRTGENNSNPDALRNPPGLSPPRLPFGRVKANVDGSTDTEIVTTAGHAKRRQTLPPNGTIDMASEKAQPIASVERRNSWQSVPNEGDKNVTSSELTVEALRQLTSGFKEKRLQRSRLSSDHRAFVLNSSPKLSIPSLSPGLTSSSKRKSMSNNDKSVDMTNNALDDLFDGLLDADETADPSLLASVDCGKDESLERGSVLKGLVEENEFETEMAKGNTPGNHNFIQKSKKEGTAALWANSEICSIGIHSFSRLDSLSPASTITSKGCLKSSDIPTGKSPRPLPEEIAFSEKAVANAEKKSPIDSSHRNLTPSKLQNRLTPTTLSGSPMRFSGERRYDDDAPHSSSNSSSGEEIRDISMLSPSKVVSVDQLTPSKLLGRLTPTTLSGSPVRIPDPASIDSPARNTRSSLKPVLETPLRSPLRQTAWAAKDKTDTLVDSPARNTRSAKKAKASPSPSLDDPTQNGETFKRKHDTSFELSVGAATENNMTYEVRSSIQKRRKSSGSMAVTLNSALRKAGSAHKTFPSGRKCVAFGSPEIVEYNIGSPSMSMTPLPATRAKESCTLPDDTIEIEADMAALLQTGERRLGSGEFSINAQDAGSTPFIGKRLAMANDSIDEDRTIELEGNLQKLIDGAVNVDSDDAQSSDDMEVDVSDADATEEFDQTVQLEVNMSTLLQQANSDKPKATTTQIIKDDLAVGNNSFEDEKIADSPLEEDITVELETDMSAMIDAAQHGIRAPHGPECLGHVAGTVKDKENEAQLEPDIENVVAAASSPFTARLRLSISDSPESKANQRRSSIASRRFSVAPESRLSISSQGDRLIVYQEDSPVERGVSFTPQFPSKAINSATSDKAASLLDLRLEELLHACPIETQECGIPDILAFLSEITLSIDASIVCDTMDAIFPQVCNEVISTMEPDIDLSSVVAPSREDAGSLIVLQEEIRSGFDSEISSKLLSLSYAVQKVEDFSWSTWVVSVAETLQGHIKTMTEELDESTQIIADSSENAIELESTLAIIADKAVRKARRKSLDRRVFDSIVLKEEITSMEAELERAKGYLEKAKREEEQTTRIIKKADQYLNISIEQEDQIREVESHEKKWVVLKGLNKWKARPMDDRNISFIFPSPFLCASISFTLGDSVECHAQIKTDVSKRGETSTRKRFQTLQPFLEERSREICNIANLVPIDQPTHIGNVLTDFVRTMSRLERTASEIASLQKRYGAILSRPLNSRHFELTVDFTSRSGHTKLLGMFVISESYPYSPVDVCLDVLEGQLNMEEIRKKLVKNAKPGFCYLSRSVDFIAACMG